MNITEKIGTIRVSAMSIFSPLGQKNPWRSVIIPYSGLTLFNLVLIFSDPEDTLEHRRILHYSWHTGIQEFLLYYLQSVHPL